MTKSSTRTSLDATIDGRDVCIEFTRVTVFIRDAHYGADADGNRGMCVDFLDEDGAEDVTVFWYDIVDGAKIDPLEHLTPAQQADVLALLDDYIEHNEPEPPEEEEPDYDRQRDEEEDR